MAERLSIDPETGVSRRRRRRRLRVADARRRRPGRARPAEPVVGRRHRVAPQVVDHRRNPPGGRVLGLVHAADPRPLPRRDARAAAQLRRLGPDGDAGAEPVGGGGAALRRRRQLHALPRHLDLALGARRRRRAVRPGGALRDPEQARPRRRGGAQAGQADRLRRQPGLRLPRRPGAGRGPDPRGADGEHVRRDPEPRERRAQPGQRLHEPGLPGAEAGAVPGRAGLAAGRDAGVAGALRCHPTRRPKCGADGVAGVRGSARRGG